MASLMLRTYGAPRLSMTIELKLFPVYLTSTLLTICTCNVCNVSTCDTSRHSNTLKQESVGCHARHQSKSQSRCLMLAITSLFLSTFICGQSPFRRKPNGQTLRKNKVELWGISSFFWIFRIIFHTSVICNLHFCKFVNLKATAKTVNMTLNAT